MILALLSELVSAADARAEFTRSHSSFMADPCADWPAGRWDEWTRVLQRQDDAVRALERYGRSQQEAA